MDLGVEESCNIKIPFVIPMCVEKIKMKLNLTYGFDSSIHMSKYAFAHEQCFANCPLQIKAPNIMAGKHRKNIKLHWVAVMNVIL